MKNLSIANPCPVNWEGMTPNESGRFCGQCQLTVVDFTSMTEIEIKNYFQCNYGKKTCGRFQASQLEDANDATTNFWPILSNKIALSFRQPSVKTCFLSTLAILAFITSCGRKPTTRHMMGEIMGDPVYIEKMDTTKITPDQQPPVK